MDFTRTNEETQTHGAERGWLIFPGTLVPRSDRTNSRDQEYLGCPLLRGPDSSHPRRPNVDTGVEDRFLVCVQPLSYEQTNYSSTCFREYFIRHVHRNSGKLSTPLSEPLPSLNGLWGFVSSSYKPGSWTEGQRFPSRRP